MSFPTRSCGCAPPNYLCPVAVQYRGQAEAHRGQINFTAAVELFAAHIHTSFTEAAAMLTVPHIDEIT